MNRVAFPISPLLEHIWIDLTGNHRRRPTPPAGPTSDRPDELVGHNLTRISAPSSGVNTGLGRITPGQKGPYAASPGDDLRQTRCGRDHFGNASPTSTLHDILSPCLTDLSLSPPTRKARRSPPPGKSLLPRDQCPPHAGRMRRGGPRTRPWQSP